MIRAALVLFINGSVYLRPIDKFEMLTEYKTENSNFSVSEDCTVLEKSKKVFEVYCREEEKK